MVERDAIGWVEAVMDDLLLRAPPLITWRADRRGVPVSVRLRCAEEDIATVVYPASDQPVATVQFARAAQRAVVARHQTPLPACRDHRMSLEPYIGEGGEPGWGCPQGDVRCAVGDFPETLWPPQWWERPDPPLVADRLQRRGLRFVGLGVDDLPDDSVVLAQLYEGADLASYEAAVAPYPFRVTRWLPPERTVRSDGQVDRDGVHYRSLSRSGVRHLAGLAGQLDRTRPNEPGDFVVTNGPENRTPVRLLAAHRLIDTDPFLLDERGGAFARVGDEARCTGGYRPSPVDNEPTAFTASELQVRQSAS